MYCLGMDMQALSVGKCARKKEKNKEESKKNGKAVVNNHYTTIIAPHRNSYQSFFFFSASELFSEKVMFCIYFFLDWRTLLSQFSCCGTVPAEQTQKSQYKLKILIRQYCEVNDPLYKIT
jgi:hypothetical protein